MGKRPLVTVFTPTYNRAYTLEALYKSLCNQTHACFEWVIVDDGSTDNTENLCASFLNDERPFSLKYFRQSNAGKHVAINRGVAEAEGTFFFIVDSDDKLTENAIERIQVWAECLPSTEFCGLGFLRATFDNQMIGSTFQGTSLEVNSLQREKFHICGDKAEIYYTDVLRECPFPVFENEKFVPEALVWNRIASKGLKMRWVNEAIYLCEYLEDGLTSHVEKVLSSNWQGYTQYAKEQIAYRQISYLTRFKTVGMYVMRAKRKGIPYTQMVRNLNCGQIEARFAGWCASLVKKSGTSR